MKQYGAFLIIMTKSFCGQRVNAEHLLSSQDAHRDGRELGYCMVAYTEVNENYRHPFQSHFVLYIHYANTPTSGDEAKQNTESEYAGRMKGFSRQFL